MIVWFAETTLVAIVLAVVAALSGRWFRLGAGARHLLWLVVLIKLLTPPILTWPRQAEPDRAEVAGVRIRRPSIDSPSRPERPSNEELSVEIGVIAEPSSPLPRRKTAFDLTTIGRVAVPLWAGLSTLLALVQIGRVVRFRHQLRWAVPAPEWIVAEARSVAERLSVRVPEVVVVSDLASPLVWFLGRPKLLLPARSVKSLGVDGWRSILAHELAHLRRGDHWVRRLEMVAGLLWWWNPLYWMTCRRLDAEAELACDASATSMFPEGRLAFAEALLEICQSLSMVRPPSPALGVAGSGRFLQRRVTMILRDHSAPRASAPVIVFAILLVLLAMPGWSTSAASGINPPGAHPSLRLLTPTTALALDDDDDDADDDDADDQDEEDDDDDDVKPAKGGKAEAAKGKEGKPAKRKSGSKLEEKKKADKLAEVVEKQLGPGSAFQKQMDELGPMLEKALEPLGKELEAKLGPGSDFEKAITEKFGPGSDFEKAITEKFGPGSDFEKAITEKFGPGSDFEKSITEKFGPGSDFEKSMKKFGAEMQAGEGRSKSGTSEAGGKPSSNKKKADKVAKEAKRSKARRIKDLQAQIEKLSEELEAMKDQEKEEDQDQ